MAEIITILGVASSIVQLVDSVAKLKGICGAYKDASTDLADLVLEISISAKHLNKSREYFEKASLLDCDLVSECLEYLGQALFAINAVSSEMQKSFSSHKRIGAMKFVWKSDQIQKLRHKLERAQRLLDRTERLVDRAERETAASEQSRQLQAIQFSNELLAQAYRQTSNTTKAYSMVHQASAAALPSLTPQLAFDSLKKTPLVHQKRASKAREYKIASQWLWSKVFDVVLSQQASSIQFSLRYYNVFPSVSDVHSAVLQGDVEYMRHLFSTKQATPFDVRDDGASLLGLAAFRCYPEMCRLLIDQGADLESVDSRGFSIVQSFAHGLSCGPRDESFQTFKEHVSEVFALIGDVALYDERLELEDSWGGSRSHLLKIIQLGGISRAKLLSPKERAEIIMECVSPDMVEDLLGPNLSIQQAFGYGSTTLPRHRHLLNRVLSTEEEEQHHWSSICRELISFDQKLDVEFFKRSEMEWIPSIACICSRQVNPRRGKYEEPKWHMPTELNSILRRQLKYLRDLGADLDLLGQTEKLLREPDTFSEFESPDKYQWRATHIISGSSPEDWQIWLAPVGWGYEWAGEFWHRVENPEMYMPGAYLEDDNW